MLVPSYGALVALACLCSDFAQGAKDAKGQTPLEKSKEKAKYAAACPPYEHYARYAQYEQVIYEVMLLY